MDDRSSQTNQADHLVIVTVLVLVGAVIVAVLIYFRANKAGDYGAMLGQGDGLAIEESGFSGGVESHEGITEIDIVGSDFKFSPNIVTVKPGQKLKVNFFSQGGVHDFVIDEYAVATGRLDTGQEESVVFIPGQKGEYIFYCSVGQHRLMGMEGRLKVE